jgi:hypothetical protein
MHVDLMGIQIGWQEIAGVAAFALIWIAIFAALKHSKSTKPSRADSRFYNRYQSEFKGWLDLSGQKHGIRGIDMNGSGAAVVSNAPVPPNSDVFLYINSQALMGWAKVKHCTCAPGGMFRRYRIGLEFRGSLMKAKEGNWRCAIVQPPSQCPESPESEPAESPEIISDPMSSR